ncbi:MAG: SAM-dependent methyltransferase [Ktedonobacteraceae bacterium]
MRIVNRENSVIVTAHPEFMQAAIAELKQLDTRLTVTEELTESITRCDATDVPALQQRVSKEHLIFVRHLAPVQKTVYLTNTEQDLVEIATEIADLPTFSQLERGTRFAVQSRFAQTDKSFGERPYSSGHLNQALAEAFAEETEAVEDIKKPQVIVSILCTMYQGYVGISTAEENLSAWPGGARHFAQTPEQVSRAEFKLLEALEYFDLSLEPGERVLDLGAAPGGWTRLLLEAGMYVVAVDPANLDPRLVRRKGLEHYRGYAEDYVEEAVRHKSTFNVIVNDMRMDAREAARGLAYASRCLKNDGFIVSVFKLPHATTTINPLLTLKDALNIMGKAYGVVQTHQLFHNRQEVTVVAAQPFPRRT